MPLHTINEKDGRKWEEATFSDLPLGGALAVLAGVKNDLAFSKKIIWNFLLNSNYMGCIMDRVGIMALTPQTKLRLGDTFEASVFLHASAPHTDGLHILVNNKEVPVYGEMGCYTVVPTHPGVYKWEAVLRSIQLDGITKEYRSPEFTYTVTASK